MALPQQFAHLKIPFEDILSATNNFAGENLIRKGRIGRIYRGKLERSPKSIDIVARRFLTNDWRGAKEFWTEIKMLASLKHTNLVSIVGFYEEKHEMTIIYKHEAKGSLDKYLSDPTFTWRQRLQVCLGIARGLSYIHYDKQRSSSVIHSNLKSSKILLDENWEPKISGFELSKTNLVARRHGFVLDSEISGTYAYADPAYIKSGGLTHKSDVYALGVILIEVMCGKKAYLSDDRDERDIPHLAKTLSNVGKLQEVVKDEVQIPQLTRRHSMEESIHENSSASLYNNGQGMILVSNVLTTGFLNDRPVEPLGHGSTWLFSQNRPSEAQVSSLNRFLRERKEMCSVLSLYDISAQLAELLSNEGKSVVLVKAVSLDNIFEHVVKEGKVFDTNFTRPSSIVKVFECEIIRWHEISAYMFIEIDRRSRLGFTEIPPPPEFFHILQNMTGGEPSSLLSGSAGTSCYIVDDHNEHISIVDRFPGYPELIWTNMQEEKPPAPEYMTTGRNLKPLQVPKEGLLSQLAKSRYEARNLDDIIHPGLRVQMESQSLKTFSEAAYCCLKEQRTQRPNIDRIIVELERALEQQLKRENSEHSQVEAEGTWITDLKGGDFEHLKIGLGAIKLATENFDKKYYIGEGGYGTVYKADLEHFDSSATKGKTNSEIPKTRSTVAIKYIFDRDDALGEQGFLSEIKILASCHHPNIISLLGFCYERPHMLLVYELASNGSLDDYLGSEGKMINLSWAQRLKICIDIARGLDYMHTTNFLDKERIIHRDIKSANILLNENLEAKIADFGLSKVHPLDHKASTLNTMNVAGTEVYLDPEYKSTGKLKKESDIYSFGVVLFEILLGRLAYDKLYTMQNEKGLAPIARQHFENGTLKKMVDPKLKDEINENSFTLSKGLNQESLDTFSRIAYKCLAEKQAKRPRIKVVITELEKALDFQENHKDSLHISFEDVALATRNFHLCNFMRSEGFGKVYRGHVVHGNVHTIIAVKRLDPRHGLDPRVGQGENEFLKELEILFEYKHDNIIGLLGYCVEEKERIIVSEYASKDSLEWHVRNARLTWTKRLRIAIDVGVGLAFLHGGDVIQDMVIHRDIKSSNILLTADWKAKIANFGLSIITPTNTETDFVVDNACGTKGYVDPLYYELNFLTKESDIYSFGVVLIEMMCGRPVCSFHKDGPYNLVPLAKRCYEEGKLDEMVFKDIKDQIVPKSLATFQMIAYQCLHDKRQDRPTASEVVEQLRKALQFQEDHEIWEPKLPSDYKEIIKMTNTPDIWSNKDKKDILDMLSKGILLQNDTLWFLLRSNDERNEIIRARQFSYEDSGPHKWRCVPESRFQEVAEMFDPTNLNIRVKNRSQLLSADVLCGVYLVFKFCDARKNTIKPMYVNLKYTYGRETLCAYFATCRDDGWMMIELCRVMNNSQDFEFLLQNTSQYCSEDGIFVEGIEIRTIGNANNDKTEKLTEVQQVLKSNLNVEYVQNTQTNLDKQVFWQSEVNGKKHLMLAAKECMYNFPHANLFCLKPSAESRFQEVIELLPQRVFLMSCMIESQMLSQDTEYICYLVFKISEEFQGMHDPVKVQDLLQENRDAEILFFIPPSPWNVHDFTRVPNQREDGWMEVNVWKFKSNQELKNGRHHVTLKFQSYEGNISGLVVCGLDFRPV